MPRENKMQVIDLSRKRYVQKVLESFKIKKKKMSTPFHNQVIPTIMPNLNKEYIFQAPYASVVVVIFSIRL